MQRSFIVYFSALNINVKNNEKHAACGIPATHHKTINIESIITTSTPHNKTIYFFSPLT